MAWHDWIPADQLTEQQAEKLATSDSLIKDGDTLVNGVSMYNFSILTSVKAWVDLACRAGHNFQYTEKGPIGLMEGKRDIVVITSGGAPLGSPMDHAST